MEEGGLIWWATFSFTSHGWPSACASLKTWYQDALWEKGKQCDATSTWMAVTWTYTTYLSIVADHNHVSMETVFPELRSTTIILRCWLVREFPRSQCNQAFVGRAGHTSPNHGGPTSPLTELTASTAAKILVPQHYFRGQAESTAWRRRDVLAAKGLTQY